MPGGHIVTIKVPPHSSWTSGLHWHETHTEFLSILQGKALVTLGTSMRTYGPEDGLIRVDRFTVHEWKRPLLVEDSNADVELVVQEWTEPADGGKEGFFRNLNSAILDAEISKPSVLSRMSTGLWIDWQIMVICYGHDNYPVFVRNEVLRRPVTHAWLLLVAMAGKVVALRASYKDYVQERGYQQNEKSK